ncbi:hypothetical protein LEP1GSC108_2774 [Leptospira weilii str. UI 13098]|uniref:Uncharacterized protein n=1 Tax=Leptospira weilii str. UI 13098 TaxID=1088542 RepID=M6Q9L2_9LEPT|nr:hypothetical protein LEP1GSC086_0149 [Leptospira weilii str. LNT 1234]EMN92331.1 hypothetical protein LEP1GSC108_2774 [Leptospira weilii str. UI 13098]
MWRFFIGIITVKGSCCKGSDTNIFMEGNRFFYELSNF